MKKRGMEAWVPLTSATELRSIGPADLADLGGSLNPAILAVRFANACSTAPLLWLVSQ
jgi:hypothetical protein